MSSAMEPDRGISTKKGKDQTVYRPPEQVRVPIAIYASHRPLGRSNFAAAIALSFRGMRVVVEIKKLRQRRQ